MTTTEQNGRPPIDDNAPIASMQLVNQSLDAWSKQVTLLGGEGFRFDRFKAVVLSCFSRTPRLMECTRYSLRQAVLAAAELGLELGGVSGEAFLIPYRNRREINGRWIDVQEATFMAGYKGYLRLAHESGLFRRIYGLPIFAADHFDPPVHGPEGVTWSHRENPFAEPAMAKIPAARWKDRRLEEYTAEVPELRGAYAVAQLLDSRTDDIVRVIPWWRLEQIRLRSKAGKDGPWITDYPEMAAKTALRALWKVIPKNERMRKLEDEDVELVPELRDADVASMFAGSASTEPPKKPTIGEKVRAKRAAAEAKKPPSVLPDAPPPAAEPKGEPPPAAASSIGTPSRGTPPTAEPAPDAQDDEDEDDQYPDGDPDQGP